MLEGRWGLLLAGQSCWHIHRPAPSSTIHHAEDMQVHLGAKHGQHSLSRGAWATLVAR